MTAGGEYQFVAWARAGVGALLGGAEATVHLPLGAAGEVTRAVRAYGPGDAQSIDPRAFVRTVPRAGARDFEPNLFPSVELAHPGLPWMLSPPPDTQGRATPWIVLIVVEQQTGVSLAQGANGVRVLTIDTPAVPAKELPDLTQAWAWAHGQTTGATGSAIDLPSLASSTGQARGRLLAPRRLDAGKSYVACVVPAFAAGVAAGLGMPSGGDGLAWAGTETTVRLPVYFSWELGTGPGGDFASLVKLLQGEKLDASVGHYTADISAPGWGAPQADGATLEVSGALRSTEWTPPPTPAAAAALGTAIVGEIDAAAAIPSGSAPVYPPPFYGAAASQKETSASAPPWQDTLNRDVGQRIAAGLGAAVVRANLDSLADAAWNAAGDAEHANQAIRQSQLAAEITQRLAQKHVAPIADDGEVLAVARPLLARMHARGDAGANGALARTRAPSDGGPTVAAAVRASAMPNAALSASFRRLARSGGPIARNVPGAAQTGAMLAQVSAGKIVPVPPKALATGAAGFDDISKEEHEQPRFRAATPEAIATAAAYWAPPAGTAATARIDVHLKRVTDVPPGEVDVTPDPISKVPHPNPVQVDEFAAAARAHQAYVVGKLEKISDRTLPPLGAPGTARPLATLRANVEGQWTAERGIVPLLASRFQGATPQILAGLDTFQQITVTGVLDQPLVRSLQALSPADVMPGVGAVEANRVALAATAPDFVRAFLVGANEELDRQLLWRGLPTALGQTWLTSFWGRVQLDANGKPAPVPDIPPIASWPPQGPDPTPATLVLLVRGDVLHRYPNALVYAVAARWNHAYRVVGDGDPLAPTFATTLGPDIAMFGFALQPDDARGSTTRGSGSAGWYFVIAEHPHEPRFGLAVSTTADDVAWTDVQPADLAGSYLRVDGPLAAAHPGWGVDAAKMASISLRRPIRVARHASTLV